MSNQRNSSDTGDRKVVAEDLYRQRGPKEASSRCDANSKFGAVDLCDEMLARLRLKPGETMVDVGCGTGQHLARFAEAVGEDGRAVGCDFSEKAVAQTQSKGLEAHVADGADLPFEAASVDAIGSSFAIYYFPDLRKAMVEWQRILRPGGRMVVSGPADDTNAELYAFHREVTGKGPADVDLLSLGYVADRLPPMLKELGFRDVEVETITNPIRFPSVDAFVEYWTNTSLFARGVPQDEREATIARGRDALKGRSDFTITKRVAICRAVR